MPIPHRMLSPNARPHWRAKAKHVAAARASAEMHARAACNTAPKWKRARVTLRWIRATARTADVQNLIAWIKPHIDGIEDAGIIENDRGLEWGAVEQTKDKANPRIEITIEEITP